MRNLVYVLFSIAMILDLSPAQGATLFDPTVIVSNGDMSANITTAAVDVNKVQNYSVQATWTGAGATGTIELQVSNDLSCATATHWSIYTSTVQSVSGAGDFLWNVAFANYHCLRLAFIKSGSSSGTLNAIYGRKI